MPIRVLDLRSSFAAVEALGKRDVAHPRHEQAERHRLRIAVRELLVRRVGEQQGPPFARERRQARIVPLQFLGHVVAQAAAQSRARLRELLGIAGWKRSPAEEVFEKRSQSRGRRERRARGFDVAFEMDHGALRLTVAPQAEAVPIGVEEVRQRLELAPLALVLLVGEPSRVGALSGRC